MEARLPVSAFSEGETHVDVLFSKFYRLEGYRLKGYRLDKLFCYAQSGYRDRLNSILNPLLNNFRNE